jgi:hypothetical protein
MRSIEYSKLRTGVQRAARPLSAAELRTTAHELERRLMATGLFADVEVDATEDPDHLVVAMCTFHPALTDKDAAARLEEVWNSHLRYGYWAAHSMLVVKGQVELQGASLSRVGGPYVTLHVVAQRAPIPVQRSASD